MEPPFWSLKGTWGCVNGGQSALSSRFSTGDAPAVPELRPTPQLTPSMRRFVGFTRRARINAATNGIMALMPKSFGNGMELK